MRKPGVYLPRRCPACGGPMAPRMRATGIRETPREFHRRKRCDVCSPQLAKPRYVHQVSLLERRQLDANSLLRQWR